MVKSVHHYLYALGEHSSIGVLLCMPYFEADSHQKQIGTLTGNVSAPQVCLSVKNMCVISIIPVLKGADRLTV